MKYFTGIDLHRKTSYLATVDERGSVVAKRNLPNDESAILSYFSQFDDRPKIVIESTASWYWLFDLLDENGFEVLLSNPLKTKAIASAKIKNDKLDALMLAQLLRSDLVATVFVSSPKTRELKELLRHRTRLVRDAARMKHRIRMILAKNNLTVPFRDLFGIKGRKCLDRLTVPAHYRSQIETYAKMYDHLDQQIEPLTDRVKKEAKTHPVAQLLVTIPGIGPILAMTIIAEIEDIARFASYRNLSSYSGLVPGLHASGQKAYSGKITKQGSPYLRWAMIEAAQAIARVKRSRLNLFFRRRIVRSGYQKAITATAHKLLQIVFYVWKNQTPYQENYSG